MYWIRWFFKELWWYPGLSSFSWLWADEQD